MPLLAVEGAVDDVAGVGQRGRKLAVEIGVVLDDEQAQRLISPLELAPVDNVAVCGVNGHAAHFATAREQSQYVVETFAMPAEPGAHQLGAPPVRMQGLDGLRQRDGPVFGDR